MLNSRSAIPGRRSAVSFQSVSGEACGSMVLFIDGGSARLVGETIFTLRNKANAPAQPLVSKKGLMVAAHHQAPFLLTEGAIRTNLRPIMGSGSSFVKPPGAKEREAVKGSWHKWPLRAKAMRVYAAKPLTAFLSRLSLLQQMSCRISSNFHRSATSHQKK